MTHRLSIVLLALVIAACGGGDAGSSDTAAAPPAADAAVNANADPTANASAAVTPADVEPFERGLRKEIEAVRAARARQASATTPAERGAAMQAQFETATAAEGAKAAGMDEARYGQVRQAMVQLLRTLDMQGKIEGPVSLDTTRVSPEQRRVLTDDPYAALAPATADAVRARLASLAAAWKEYIELTAVGG